MWRVITHNWIANDRWFNFQHRLICKIKFKVVMNKKLSTKIFNLKGWKYLSLFIFTFSYYLFLALFLLINYESFSPFNSFLQLLSSVHFILTIIHISFTFFLPLVHSLTPFFLLPFYKLSSSSQPTSRSYFLHMFILQGSHTLLRFAFISSHITYSFLFISSVFHFLICFFLPRISKRSSHWQQH